MTKHKELYCPLCKKIIDTFNEKLTENVQGKVWHPECFNKHVQALQKSLSKDKKEEENSEGII